MPNLRSPLLLVCAIALHEALAFQSLVAKPATVSRKASALTPRNRQSSSQRSLHGVMLSSSLDSTSSYSSSTRRRRRQLNKDVVIIGGGLAGLSAAMYLSQIDPDRHITILDKEDILRQEGTKTAVSSFAAAGMLAPQSERLPKGRYLDLCMESKRMFPDFADLVECMAQEAGEEGEPYLTEDPSDSNNKWNLGILDMWPRAGFWHPPLQETMTPRGHHQKTTVLRDG